MIGVQDEESGEIPKAFVVIKEGESPTAEEIDAIHRRVGSHFQADTPSPIRRLHPQKRLRQDTAPRTDRAGAGRRLGAECRA
ncbi:MAG: hypothetical protein J4N87_04195, partial [Chloroflexi bacterium]|nr:hypothetical protein [Chloroflexota bacterium]